MFFSELSPCCFHKRHEGGVGKAAAFGPSCKTGRQPGGGSENAPAGVFGVDTAQTAGEIRCQTRAMNTHGRQCLKKILSQYFFAPFVWSLKQPKSKKTNKPRNNIKKQKAYSNVYHGPCMSIHYIYIFDQSFFDLFILSSCH